MTCCFDKRRKSSSIVESNVFFLLKQPITVSLVRCDSYAKISFINGNILLMNNNSSINEVYKFGTSSF